MITKSTVHLLYIDLIEKNIDKIENPIYFLEYDVGTVFTFSRFLYTNKFFLLTSKLIFLF